MTRKLYTAAMVKRSGLSENDAHGLAYSIRWCVDRMHISATRRDILKMAFLRIKLAAARRRKAFVLTREARKFVYRVALRARADNVLIYRRFVLRRI